MLEDQVVDSYLKEDHLDRNDYLLYLFIFKFFYINYALKQSINFINYSNLLYY